MKEAHEAKHLLPESSCNKTTPGGNRTTDPKHKVINLPIDRATGDSKETYTDTVNQRLSSGITYRSLRPGGVVYKGRVCNFTSYFSLCRYAEDDDDDDDG